MLRRACVFAFLVACGGHHATSTSRCGPAEADVAMVYWDVGIYGAWAVGVGGWYDPYTYDEWGDGTIDDGTDDSLPPDDTGGDTGEDTSDDTGGDTGDGIGDEGSAFRITPADFWPNASGCFACPLTCVYAAPAGQANAVTSVGASDASYAAACASAQRQLGRWGRDHRTRFDACRAPAPKAERVPARPTPN